MKKLFISKVFLMTVLIAWTLTSCKQEPKSEDPKEAAEDQNDALLDDTSAEDEATFFVDIAAIETGEIKLSEHAIQKTTNADVKSFAKMMVTDHTKSSMELKKLADERKISLPSALTDDGIDKYKDLDEKSGLEFDKKYVEMMIDDHEKVIKKMEDASEDTDKDPTVKAWASNKIAGLTAHLQHAKMLKEKLDKK